MILTNETFTIWQIWQITEKDSIDKELTSLDFNYVKLCFDLFQFSFNFMTKEFSNLNLNIKSIRNIGRQTDKDKDYQTDKDGDWLTDRVNRQTKSETYRQRMTETETDWQTEMIEQREHISTRTKSAISFNSGKINAIAPEKSLIFVKPFIWDQKSYGWFAELQRIIRIIRYSNSWDRIVLFVFGIRSICNFRIVFEYPNSCYQIPNSYRLFIKQNVYQKSRKKGSYSCKKKD